MAKPFSYEVGLKMGRELFKIFGHKQTLDSFLEALSMEMPADYRVGMIEGWRASQSGLEQATDLGPGR